MRGCFNWFDRCSNHAKRLFSLQYPLLVLHLSDVESLLPFSDSASYYCVSIQLLFLWWSKINQK